MRGKLMLLSLGAVAIAAAGFAVGVYAVEGPPGNELAALVQGEASQYVLKNNDGKLTVYFENSDLPELETDIDISGLREYDRELLENGIEAASYESMLSLLEDFSN